MIELTAPDGSPIEVKAAAIEEIYVAHAEYGTKAKSVILIGGQHQAVCESVQEIDALLSKVERA